MNSEFNFGSLRKKTPRKAKKVKPVTQSKKDPNKRIFKKKTPKILTIQEIHFNSFMNKLEKSNSYAAKHLKEKLNVKGKHKAINKERVIRNIRDVIDVINE